MKLLPLVILPMALIVTGAVVANAQVALPLVVNGIDAMPQGGEDGHGIMNDAVMALLKRAGLTGTMQFLPWKRAQRETITGKNVLITGLSRTPEREASYTWLVPVFRIDRAFLSLDTPITNFEDAKTSLRRIAVTSGTAQYDILLREGFSTTQLSVINIEQQKVIPALLLTGRAEAWFAATSEVRYVLRNHPDAFRFITGPVIGESTDQYIACSRDCDPGLVAKLKAAGEEMQADGSFRAILELYQ